MSEYLSVHPNPFKDFIQINTSKDFFITDILGNLIYSGSQKTINTGEWESGIYFIHLNDYFQSSIKVVKVK